MSVPTIAHRGLTNGEVDVPEGATSPQRAVWLAALVAGAVHALDTESPIAALESGELLADESDLRMLRVLDRARREIADILNGGGNGG